MSTNWVSDARINTWFHKLNNENLESLSGLENYKKLLETTVANRSILVRITSAIAGIFCCRSIQARSQTLINKIDTILNTNGDLLIAELERDEIRKHEILRLCAQGANITARSMHHIPENERVSVIVAAVPLMEGLPSGPRRVVINVVKNIPATERTARVEALKRLINAVSRYHIDSCIVLASELPLAQINEIALLPPGIRMRTLQQERGLFSAYKPNAYVITVKRSDIQEKPRAILHDLIEKFKAGERLMLNVAFSGEPGTDASGLSKEFITLLFDSLKSNLRFGVCKNGLYRLTAVQSDDERAVYRELGQLILFCLNAENYPIGMVFDAGVFAALSTLLKNLGEMNAYKALHWTEDDKSKMRLIQTALEQQSRGVSDDITGNPAQEIQGNMQPFIEVAQGIKEAPFTKITWQHVRDMSPDEFSTRLQGSFSTELVLNNLKFDAKIPLEKQAWIREWVRTTTVANVKQFLFAVTGSTTVGKRSLKIQNRDENFYFHTCINSVDMPLDKIENKELFISLLESAISGPGNYSRS